MSDQNSSLPSVFEYQNFRDFLHADFNHRKKTRQSWSYASWAKKLGTKSSSGLLMILQGRRIPGNLLTRSLIQYFGFSEDEARYFRLLVALERSKDDDSIKQVLLERLKRDRVAKSWKRIDRSTFLRISKWYGYALRQSLSLKSFVEDPVLLARRFIFPVSADEIRDTIHALVEVGLLDRDETGALRRSKHSVNTEDDVADEGLKRYHEQVLENARDSVRRIPPQDREISGLTLTMRASDTQKAKEMIRRFQDEFAATFSSDDATSDAVFQLETVLIPVYRD